MRIAYCASCHSYMVDMKLGVEDPAICASCSEPISRNNVFPCDSLGKTIFAAIKVGGTVTLNDPKCLISIMSDVAPSLSRDIRVFSKTLESPSSDLLIQALNSKDSEVDSLTCKIKALLVGEEGLSESWAEKISVSIVVANLYLNNIAPEIIEERASKVVDAEDAQKRDSAGYISGYEKLDEKEWAMQNPLMGVDIIRKGTSQKSNEGIEEYLHSQTMTQADNSVHLGILAVSSGDLDRGTKYFEDALKINPNHVGAYLGLVWSLPYEKRKPYFERLSAFPLERIKSFISNNKEMLSSDKVSLLESVLQNSGSSGSVGLVKVLLESGANAVDTYALYYAVISQYSKELVPLLLKYGANPNGEYQLRFADDIVETHIALADVIWNTGDTELAKLLIIHRANVNYVVKSTEARDYSGNGKKCNWSLLDMAVRKNNESMVQLLLQNGADANSGRWTYRKYWMTQVSSWGREEVFYYALSEAIWNAKNIGIVKLLLESGANPNYQYRDIHQNNMSMYSSFLTDECSGLYDVICFSDSVEILKLMLRYEADPNIKYRCTWTDWDLNDHVEEATMIELARSKNKDEMVRTLEEYFEQEDLKAKAIAQKQQLIEKKALLEKKLSEKANEKPEEKEFITNNIKEIET